MESRSKDKDGFGLTRRIPAKVRSGVSPGTLAKLDVRESGLMVFRNFNNQDAEDRKLFASIWSAIISRDRTNQIACFTTLMNAGVWQLLKKVLDNRPDNAYAPDFIYLDGAPEGAAFHGAEEIHLLEERLAPGTVVLIDGRFKALQFFLNGNMKRRWRVVTQTLAVDHGQEKLSVPPALDLFSNSMCILAE